MGGGGGGAWPRWQEGKTLPQWWEVIFHKVMICSWVAVKTCLQSREKKQQKKQKKIPFRHKGHLDEIPRFGKRAKVTTSETAAFGIWFTVAFFSWLKACHKLGRKCFTHIYLPCLCWFLILAQKFFFSSCFVFLVFFFTHNNKLSR